MAVCFSLAAVASPALGIHESVGHAHGHHRHDSPGNTSAIGASHHAHDGHDHWMLSEARASTRAAHDADTGAVTHAVRATLSPGHDATWPVLARPNPRPPRSRHPHSITTVLRI